MSLVYVNNLTRPEALMFGDNLTLTRQKDGFGVLSPGDQFTITEKDAETLLHYLEVNLPHRKHHRPLRIGRTHKYIVKKKDGGYTYHKYALFEIRAFKAEVFNTTVNISPEEQDELWRRLINEIYESDEFPRYGKQLELKLGWEPYTFPENLGMIRDETDKEEPWYLIENRPATPDELGDEHLGIFTEGRNDTIRWPKEEER